MSEQWFHLIGAVLLAAGGFFCLGGALGLVRFPDVLARMHAATKPQVFGLLLVLLGVGFSIRDPKVWLTLLVVILLQVLTALIPGIAAYAWLLGLAVLVQIAIATVTALLAEAAMLKLQDKPLRPFLGDGSAVVTAWLIALAFPPLAP